MATEQHREIISVEYSGTQNADRFAADQEKMARSAEQAARRISEAMRNGQGALDFGRAPEARGPLQLPAGRGGTGENLAAQQDFVRSLRERAEAERASAASTRRAQAFQERLMAAGSRPDAAGISFGPGGNPQIQFDAGLRDSANEFSRLTDNLRTLNARVKAAEAHFANQSNRSLDREIKQFAEDANRHELRAIGLRANANRVTDGEGLQAVDLEEKLAAARANTNAGRTLLHHGEASSTLLNALTAEQRQMLLGSPEGPKAYGATATTGPRIPGLTSYAEARSQLQGQKYGALYENQRGAEREMAQYMESRQLEARKVLAIETAETQAARRAQTAQDRLAAAADRRAKFQERIAAEEKAYILPNAFSQGPGPYAKGGSGAGGSGGSGNGRSGGSSTGGPADDDWVRRLNEEVRNMEGSGGFSALYRAQAKLITAEQKLADIIDRGNKKIGSKGGFKTEEDRGIAYRSAATNYDQAQQNLTRVLNERTKAEEAATNAAKGGAGAVGGGAGGGRGGGFFSDFAGGFRGNRDTPIAAQLGQTARFSVFYGTMYKLLFGITQTFSQSLAEGIAFEDALTNLVIAADKPRAELEGLAGTLSEQSVRAGFAPSQGVEIGARSLGLYGASTAPLNVQSQVAEISARVVSQLAVGSKKDPVQLQGDIAAIGQALGTGAVGQQRIADLDAYFTKRFGVQQGSTLETVAQSASVGKAAGFSDEQLFAIAADMISRTGQSSSAVAGFMAQIFSRGGEGSLVDVAAKQGIDPNQELSQIVGQLAQIYKTADPRSQSEISAAFGRGKVQNAAVALLSDYGEVQDASAKGVTGSAGAADKQFQEHMNNIGGQLRELGGELRQFAQLFGQAGLLDAIGAGVFVLKEFVQAANTLLGLWNELPRPMRDFIILLGAAAALQKTGLAGSAVSNLALRGGGARAGAAFGEGGLMAAALGERAGLAGGAKAVAKGLFSMIGPIGLAIGGFIAIGSVVSSVNRMREAQDAATLSLQGGSLSPLSSTASDYRAQAAEVGAQAEANRSATGGFTNFITGGLANNSNVATAQRLEAEAKRLEKVAAGVRAADSGQSGTFRSLASGDIKTGLDTLTASGATAQIQLRALRDVLYGTAAAAQQAKEAFDPKKFSGRAAGDLVSAGLGSLDDLGRIGGRTINGGRAGGFIQAVNGKDIKNDLAGILTGKDVQKRLQESLASRGIDSLADLDNSAATGVAGDITNPVVDQLIKQLGPGVVNDTKAVRAAIRNALRDKLLGYSIGAREALSGDTRLSGEDATALAGNLVAQNSAYTDTLGDSDNRGRIAAQRGLIRDLRRTRSRTNDPNGIAGINQQISQARTTLVENQLAEIDAIRKTAYQNATSKAAINSAGRSALTQSINAIVKNGSADQLVTLVQQAGKGSIAMAKQAINDAIRIAQASMVLGAEAAQLGALSGQGAGAAFRGRGAAEENAGANATISRLRKMAAALGEATYGGGKDNKFSFRGLDVFNPKFGDGADKAEKDKETLAEREAARAAAAAQASRNPVAAAKASLLSAKAAMDKADKNSVEYWNAVGQYNDAQNALADALAAVPVAKAQALASQKGGAIAAAKASIMGARAALKTAEGDQAAYWAAMGQYYEGERSLRDAILANQKNVMLLGTDMTNPLKVAQVDTRAAALKLAADRRAGQSPDVINQDRVDLKSAQNNAEATRFNQRLQSVQTAEQLGRISHTKYLAYLDNEHRRLEAVKHRTFQQQQELDQIDGLMKDAATAMQGQWNFGDIKLPTPYEVRRYVQQTAGAAIKTSGSTQGANYQTVTIQVNGADTAKVTRIVQDVVGKSARTTTTATRRR